MRTRAELGRSQSQARSIDVPARNSHDTGTTVIACWGIFHADVTGRRSVVLENSQMRTCSSMPSSQPNLITDQTPQAIGCIQCSAALQFCLVYDHTIVLPHSCIA